MKKFILINAFIALVINSVSIELNSARILTLGFNNSEKRDSFLKEVKASSYGFENEVLGVDTHLDQKIYIVSWRIPDEVDIEKIYKDVRSETKELMYCYKLKNI